VATWKDILIDVLKLTDEVRRLDSTTTQLAQHTLDLDKRLVRLETMAELSQAGKLLIHRDPTPGE